jgi:hypothetical protein
MILSKFGDWCYSIKNEIMECDDNWESDVVIIQTPSSSQSSLLGRPVDFSGVTVSNIYDEAMNRIGIMEVKDASEEYLFFDGWKNPISLFFQNELFEYSTLELKDLIPDKSLFKWNTWIEQYHPNIQEQEEVDILFKKGFPYTIIDLDSFEIPYQHPKSGIIFMNENNIIFWDSRPINKEEDFPIYITNYLKNPIKNICF